jgi:hypothetical protein
MTLAILLFWIAIYLVAGFVVATAAVVQSKKLVDNFEFLIVVVLWGIFLPASVVIVSVDRFLTWWIKLLNRKDN